MEKPEAPRQEKVPNWRERLANISPEKLRRAGLALVAAVGLSGSADAAPKKADPYAEGRKVTIVNPKSDAGLESVTMGNEGSNDRALNKIVDPEFKQKLEGQTAAEEEIERIRREMLPKSEQ